MTKNKSVISVSLLLLLSLLWGSSFLFTKILVEDLHPVSLIFIRCLFGLVMLAPILLFQKNFDQTKIDVYVCQFSQSRGRDSLDVDGLFTSVFT